MFKRMIILLMVLAFVIPATAQVKQSEITITTTIAGDSEFTIVFDSSGTLVTRNITWTNLLVAMRADLVLGDSVFFNSAVSMKPVLYIKNTNADIYSGKLRFQKDSATPADGDYIGIIDFYGDDGGGLSREFGAMRITASEIDAGDYCGRYSLRLAVDAVDKSFINAYGNLGGTPAHAIIVYNDDGIDMDQRWESDTDANAFFIDGATGYVGKGDPTPDEDFDVEGDIITGETANADAHDVLNYMTTKVWCDSTVTADTDFGAILPAGYYIDTIIFKNTTAAAIGAHFCVGFSAGGEQIVADVAVGASDEGSFTILQSVDDFDAADNIFVDSDDWNSASLIIWIKMNRMF